MAANLSASNWNLINLVKMEDFDMNKSFDKRLQALLSVTGMTRKDLAARLGVTVPVVSRWCNGSSVPDVYQFREIAQIFGMPYEWFLDGGDGFPSEEELAERLGLAEDTVANLMELSRTESEEVLDALDNAVYALIGAVATAREDQ